MYLHPEFLTGNGEREFAVLPHRVYVALREWLEDIEDLLDLREARSEDGDLPSTSLEEAEREFGIK